MNLNFPPTTSIVGNGQLGHPPATPVNIESNNLLPAANPEDVSRQDNPLSGNNLPPGNNLLSGSGTGNTIPGQGRNGGNPPLGQAAPWAADLQVVSAAVQSVGDSVRALQDEMRAELKAQMNDMVATFTQLMANMSSMANTGPPNTSPPNISPTQNGLPGDGPSILPSVMVAATSNHAGMVPHSSGTQALMAWAQHSTPINSQTSAVQPFGPPPPPLPSNPTSYTGPHQFQNWPSSQNPTPSAIPRQGLQQQLHIHQSLVAAQAPVGTHGPPRPQGHPLVAAQQWGQPTQAASAAPYSQSAAPPAAQARTRPVARHFKETQGCAIDTDDEEMTFSNRVSDTLGGSDRNQGRGRNRTRATRGRPSHQGLDQVRHSDSGEDDPDDGYADNRETLEFRCRNLTGIKEFDSTEKNGNFNIFITKFEDAVNRCHNPHSKRRHHIYCLKWLPSFLSTDAFTVWRRSPHRKTNWEELKKELRKEFEDPIIRSEWKSNLRAYTWDEAKETLHSYCSNVRGYVDTFEPDLEEGSRAKLDAYYTRFVSGLSDDYQRQIKLYVPTNKQTISRAYDTCLRYQAALNG